MQRGRGNHTNGGQASDPGTANASSPQDFSEIDTLASPRVSAADEDVALLAESRTDAWLDEFENAWLVALEDTTRSTTSPRLHDFLGSILAAGTVESKRQIQILLRELIAINLEHRWKRQVSRP